MPEWADKLIRRILALPPGVYVIVLTKDGKHFWSIGKLGKIENAKPNNG